MDMPLWSDTGLWAFIVLTIILGGATASAAGRAVAMTWRPMTQVFIYAAILAAAVRFLSYALFEGVFFISPENPVEGLWRWGLAYVILAAIGALAYRQRRATQMATQYSWLTPSRA